MLRISLKLFPVILLLSLATSPALTCSRLRTPLNAEVFYNAISVFKGVATSAELLDATAINPNYKDLPVVRIHWRVDEVYKGPHLKNTTTMTQYFCFPASVVVGLPYVVVVNKISGINIEEQEKWDLLLRGVDGVLNYDGTAGLWGDSLGKSEKLVQEFKALSVKQ